MLLQAFTDAVIGMPLPWNCNQPYIGPHPWSIRWRISQRGV